MELASQVRKKNDIESDLRDLRSELTQTVEQTIQDHGYDVIETDFESTYLDFTVTLRTAMLDDTQLNDINDWFEEYEYSAVKAVEKDGTEHIRIFFECSSK